MHPYRDLPERPPAKKPGGLPSEEWFLIFLLVVIGGLRFFIGILAGLPLDGEATLGMLGLALGLYCGFRGIPWVRRRRERRSGNLHDDHDSDRAPPCR